MKHYIMKYFLMLTLGIVLIGCGKVTLEGENGKESLNFKSNEDGKVIVTDEEGKELIRSDDGENVELPEGFPKDFPFSDDVQLDSASVMPFGDNTSYHIYFSYSEDPDSIYDAIKEYAINQGLEVIGDSKNENEKGMFYSLSAVDGAESIQLRLNSPGESGNLLNYTIAND